MESGLTCIVTVHGIGFQVPPHNGQGGYADELHTNLRQSLGNALGDDPHRETGPVYVQSEWPAKSKDTEHGLHRIGSWDRDHRVVSGEPLASPGAAIAHVALVYSGDEEHVADPLAGSVMAMLGVEGILHYASPEGLVETFGNNLRGLFHPRTPPKSAAEAGVAKAAGSHPLTALVDHVGGYVARNVLRERVRGFLLESIVRLAAREDVARLVLNTHSNGTVLVFDVLPEVPAAQASKLALYVTAGTPLRKYVQLLSWGYEIENWPDVPWINYYDITDPVADQLLPPYGVKITGDPNIGGYGLFVAYGPDDRKPAVKDVLVSNVDAGRDAHDYWGNLQFCRLLSDQVKAVVSG
jgi:hypothetical protein